MRFSTAILFSAVFLPAASDPGRLAPPAAITCPRDHLTSFMGRVSAWERTTARIRFKMHTDEATIEKFEIPLAGAEDPARLLLIEGRPFRASDWTRIEMPAGRLRDPMRAIVWVCDDGSRPLVDFRPPEPGPPAMPKKEERP